MAAVIGRSCIRLKRALEGRTPLVRASYCAAGPAPEPASRLRSAVQAHMRAAMAELRASRTACDLRRPAAPGGYASPPVPHPPLHRPPVTHAATQPHSRSCCVGRAASVATSGLSVRRRQQEESSPPAVAAAALQSQAALGDARAEMLAAVQALAQFREKSAHAYSSPWRPARSSTVALCSSGRAASALWGATH